MTWLAWRQLRANALFAAAAATAVVVVLALTREHIERHAGSGDLSTGYESLRLLGTGLVGMPAFIGAFWGAPLLARELEAGTHRLAWTQGVTRRRWLATKLAVAGVTAAVFTAVFSLVFTWWSLPFDRLGNRIGTANFGQRGVAPIAYTVFALALGALAGAVLRRTLPAMATTLVGFFVVRFAFQWIVRPRLIAPVALTLPNHSFGQRVGETSSYGGWIMSSSTVDGSGHVLTASQVDRLLVDSCSLGRDSSADAWEACAHRVGLRDLVKIHPADHFWTLQAWESACFLLIAAALAFACFWWVRHRTA